jgi:hypothetical protein
MAEKENQSPNLRQPAGFTTHSSGLASEYAREQGWEMNEEERTKTPSQKQDYDGGSDYSYGARDFGDAAFDARSAQIAPERSRAVPGRPKKAT